MSQLNDFSQTNIQIVKEIGAGSFGKVYSGTLKSNGLKIAIKRVNKKKISEIGDYLIEAFRKELQCMEKCNCDNSVRLYTHFETNNNFNIIMELCDSDLSKELKKTQNGFNVEEVRFIMSQLNNVFRIMVRNNIIHRDLKLLNILVSYSDKALTKFIPKLCDYGFSKQLKDQDPVTNTHLGTPSTMAPEIMLNQGYGPEADLWSIGVIIYNLHFKTLPYKGNNEKEILAEIQKKVPYAQPKDPEMRDLINKLLVEDPKKRMTWKEYFNHPFFLSEEEKEKLKLANKDENIPLKIEENFEEKKDVTYVGIGTRYIYERDFDVGLRNEMFKCCIAYDTKKNKKVIIKSYHKNFISSHELLFKMEYNLIRTFLNNNNFLQIINLERETYYHFIFDFVDCEILPLYMTHNKFDENKLTILNNQLIENIFNFSEINFKPFIFISLYSFAITKEGNPIIFDFGLNKFFLPPEEVTQYYIPNKMEIAETSYPIKTNVMNYGITLLKIFYGKTFQIKIINDEIILPENNKMSEDMKIYISKCLKKNIIYRNSWFELKMGESLQNSDTNNEEKQPLISDKKLGGIFKSLDNKYSLINKYYSLTEINEKTPYINEMEYFLILTLFEQLLVLKILKNEDNSRSDVKKEMSFLTIYKNKAEELKINFGNPLLKNMKIFHYNETINNFISKLQSHICKLKEITLKIHKITKSTYFKNNYQDFLKEFNKIMTDDKFKDYFLSLTKEANEDWFHKRYENVKLKAPIAEYLSENVLFIISSILNIEKEKIYFDREELLQKFDDIFDKEDEDNIEVSCVKLAKEKEKYISVSFLGLFYKNLINSMDFNKLDLKRNKASLEKIIEIYAKLMEKLVDKR